MITAHFGEFAALVTALSWTLTAIVFEAAGRKIGSLAVNFIRLIVAFIFIGVFCAITRGMFLPLDATGSQWFWLFISGMIGFVIGDLFLFQAYVEIGSRTSQLIMASSPPITALAGYLIMGEKLTLLHMVGIFITISGITTVILVKGEKEKKVKLSHPARGVLFAFIGSLGQALGLIFSKYGMENYNPFAATQIRIIAAIIGFAVIITVRKRWRKITTSFLDTKAIGLTSIGAFFGPFIGVSLSLLALQYTSTGIVSTITSLTPIFIIPLAVFFFKEKVTVKEVVGVFVTIAGVALLFI